MSERLLLLGSIIWPIVIAVCHSTSLDEVGEMAHGRGTDAENQGQLFITVDGTSLEQLSFRGLVIGHG